MVQPRAGGNVREGSFKVHYYHVTLSTRIAPFLVDIALYQ